MQWHWGQDKDPHPGKPRKAVSATERAALQDKDSEQIANEQSCLLVA